MAIGSIRRGAFWRWNCSRSPRRADDHVYLIVNGGGALTATLPPATGSWRIVLDSSDASQVEHTVGVTARIPARAVVVLVDDPKSPRAGSPGIPGTAGAAGRDRAGTSRRQRARSCGQRRDQTGSARRDAFAGGQVPADVRASLHALETAPWQTCLAAVRGRRGRRALRVRRRSSTAPKSDRSLEADIVLEDGNRAHFAGSAKRRPAGRSPTDRRPRAGEVARRDGDCPCRQGCTRFRSATPLRRIAATPGRAWQPAIARRRRQVLGCVDQSL